MARTNLSRRNSTYDLNMARNNLSRRNSTYDLNLNRRNSTSGQPGFSVSGNLLTVTSLDQQQETNPRILAKPEDAPSSSGGSVVHTKDKRQAEGKASQLWGWLARRVQQVASSRRNSLHISVISEQEQEQEAGRREEDSDWLQDQFEGMTYEEIAVWVSDILISFLLLGNSGGHQGQDCLPIALLDLQLLLLGACC